MARDVYSGGLLTVRWDDTARTVTTYDETGAVTGTRPYTEAENANADAEVQAQADDEAARAGVETNSPDSATTMAIIAAIPTFLLLSTASVIEAGWDPTSRGKAMVFDVDADGN